MIPDKFRGREANYPASNRVQYGLAKSLAIFASAESENKITVHQTWLTRDTFSEQTGARPARQLNNA